MLKLAGGGMLLRADVTRMENGETKVQVVAKKEDLFRPGDTEKLERDVLDGLRVQMANFIEASSQTSPQEKKEGKAPPLPPVDVDTPPRVKVKVNRNAYAVVIGIETYRDLPKADYAVRDAEVMKNYLVKVMGYPEENVILRTNERAGRTDLEKYFETWLKNNVEKDSSVFVYYSGHGAPNVKTGEAYLVPYDGDPVFLEKTAYPLKSLYATLNQLPTNQVFVMLDSCFSGAGGRSVIAKGTRPMFVTSENPLLASDKMVVLSASAGEQISSSYAEKRHGLFTYFFLKGLSGGADANKDRTVELGELYTYVKAQVETTARKVNNVEQTPQLLPPLETSGPRAQMRLVDLPE